MTNDELAERMDALQLEFTETDEFLDWQNAAKTVGKAIEQGAKEVTLPTAFLAQTFDQFQPLDYLHLREVYNRLCDKHGLPEEKQPVPTPGQGTGETF